MKSRGAVRRQATHTPRSACVVTVAMGHRRITNVRNPRIPPLKGHDVTVELTDEQFGIVARALVVIAAGKKVKADGRITEERKDVLINRAREAASALKLNYLGDGSGRSSFPQEIGLDRLLPKQITPKRICG